jgi:hypothetical protein
VNASLIHYLPVTYRNTPFVALDGGSISLSTVAGLRDRPDVTRLRIGGLTQNLAVLEPVRQLRELDLLDPETLDGLDRLQQRESLMLYALPQIKSFDTVGKLANLRTLMISTPPGYDASRKCYEVETLEPLAQLSHLERLTMRGILPATGRLDPIRRIKSLRHVDISHVYAFDIEDYARLARALPAAEGHCLQPVFEAHWTGVCSRCGSRKVALTAPPPRTARTACPVCHAARIARHLAAWNVVAKSA